MKRSVCTKVLPKRRETFEGRVLLGICIPMSSPQGRKVNYVEGNFVKNGKV